MAAGRKRRRLAVGIVFVVYFIVLFYFLFFSEEFGRTDTERVYHYNLVLFKEIGRFIRYRDILGTQAVILNILGNVVAFMPFGTCLPVFVKRCRRFWFAALYSFGLSLVVELLQLLSRVGTFDVDDILLNTIGGMLGFALYQMIRYIWNKWRESR